MHRARICCEYVSLYRERQPSKRTVIDHVMLAVIRAPFVHPLRLITSLIQFGYEPVEPTRQFSFIVGRYLYYYPGVIGYTRHICNESGWRALYRGVGPAIVEEVVNEVARDVFQPLAVKVVNFLPLHEAGDSSESPDNVGNINTVRATLVRAAKGFIHLSISSCLIELVTHPFHTVTLRTIAQHVGEESLYNGFMRAVREIYTTEGIRGFYNGLMPALVFNLYRSLLYEIITIVIEGLVHIVPYAAIGAGVSILKVPVANYITGTYSYPLLLISNMMSINGAPLAIGSPPRTPIFSDWKECRRYLSASGNLFRGNVIFLSRFAHNHRLNKL